LPSDRHWVGTWAAAPAPAEGVVGFNNHTLRMNPRISLGGDRLRVRISNAYGNRPLTIGAAQVALRDKGPAIVADTGRKLSFGGSDSAVIAAGAVLFSDPVELSVPPLADLASAFICRAKCWRISRSLAAMQGRPTTSRHPAISLPIG
jgi:hypothetical protein